MPGTGHRRSLRGTGAGGEQQGVPRTRGHLVPQGIPRKEPGGSSGSTPGVPGRAVGDGAVPGAVPGAGRCWSAPGMWWTRSAFPCASGTPSGTITRTGASPMAGETTTLHRNPTPLPPPPWQPRDPQLLSPAAQPPPPAPRAQALPIPGCTEPKEPLGLLPASREQLWHLKPSGKGGTAPIPLQGQLWGYPDPNTAPPEAPAPSRDPAPPGPS